MKSENNLNAFKGVSFYVLLMILFYSLVFLTCGCNQSKESSLPSICYTDSAISYHTIDTTTLSDNLIVIPVQVYVDSRVVVYDDIINMINRTNEDLQGYIYLIPQYVGIFLHDEKYTLDDYYYDRASSANNLYENEIKSTAVDTALNIFVLPSSKDSDLLGFTPILSTSFDYHTFSPDYDIIYISDESASGSTLQHELGHWLGLYHTFELTIEERNILGLSGDKLCTNHMGYHCYTDSYTKEQLAVMVNHAITYRNYIIK